MTGKYNQQLLARHSVSSVSVCFPAQVGPSSEFARSLHSQLETTLWTAFEKQVVDELGKQVKPILSQALARVCNRLVKKFCVRGGPPQLRSALQPAYEWRHDDAPLRTWLRAELSKHVDLSFVLKVRVLGCVGWRGRADQ